MFSASLSACKRPFVFASVRDGGLSQNVQEKIKAASDALLIDGFFDQIGVLNHPSTGWFLTHGGWNSVQEAMVIGKPMMVWPLFQGDQQILGAQVSTRDEPIGFEFLQVSSRSHDHPILCRFGIGKVPPSGGLESKTRQKPCGLNLIPYWSRSMVPRVSDAASMPKS